jgi:hypothetical protein
MQFLEPGKSEIREDLNAETLRKDGRVEREES